MSEEQTTAVATTERNTKPPIAVGKDITGGLIPTTFDELWRMAEVLAASGMMPKGLEKPAQVFVAIQMGLEIGLSPMQAIQNIAIINGRPAVWGDAMLALVMSSGQSESFREYFDGRPYDDDFAAVCEVKRKGRAPSQIAFTVADAKKAGLWGKAGPWCQYPQRMLQMRARSWALRDQFPDVLKGLHSAEEIQDSNIIDVTPAEEMKPAPRAVPKTKTQSVREKLAARADREMAPAEVVDDETGEVAEGTLFE